VAVRLLTALEDDEIELDNLTRVSTARVKDIEAIEALSLHTE
jgi:hypothetical protein